MLTLECLLTHLYLLHGHVVHIEALLLLVQVRHKIVNSDRWTGLWVHDLHRLSLGAHLPLKDF